MNADAADPLEEPFSELLAAYDEALAAGRAPDPITLPYVPSALREAQQCLHLLEAVWPRSTSSHFLTPNGAAAPTHRTSPESRPVRIGRFTIERELGRGGCGIVFLAIDPRLGRPVALKVPRPEVLLTRELRQRFLREGQAAAGLDHPNLVPVHEAGETETTCYLVSTYCEGPTLAAWLAQQSGPIPVRTAAALLAVLAEAVQHAHARGILHRDLKPANILLQCQPPGESRHAGYLEELGSIPRLTDFGLAKFADGLGETRQGLVMGTPQYMAPEQAAGWHDREAPPTDVYALGAILYQVLTGRLPRGPQPECGELIEPRRLRRDVPRDLEAICLKCLEREPARRYPTAAALAKDLRLFLAGEPTRARPASAGQRALRWLRLRPATLTLVASLAVALAGVLAGGLWYRAQSHAQDAKLRAAEGRERQRTEEANREQERQARRRYPTQIQLVQKAWETGTYEHARALLEDLRPQPGREDLRGFEWHYLRGQVSVAPLELRGHTDGVGKVAYAPDGKTVATSSIDRTVKLWNATTGQLQATLTGHTAVINALDFAPDGRTLATGGADKTVRIWDLDTGQTQTLLTHNTDDVYAVRFSPDGRTLASSGRDRVVYLWDMTSRQLRASLTGHNGHVHALTFSPDGRALASGDNESLIRLWDVSSARLRATLPTEGTHPVLLFSPDGQLLVSGGSNRVQLWDTVSWQRRAFFQGIGKVTSDLAFAPDGRTLAVAGGDWPVKEGLVQLWDVTAFAAAAKRPGSGNLPSKPVVRATFPYRLSGTPRLSYAPDGRGLLVGTGEGIAWIWRLGPEQEKLAALQVGDEVWSVAFSPDGRTLATGSDNEKRPAKPLLLWETATGRERLALRGHWSTVSAVAFAPDGQTVASGSYDRTAKLWDPGTGKLRATLLGHQGAVRVLAYAPDGRLLATGGNDGLVKLWDGRTGAEQRTLTGHGGKRVRCVTFAPDGRALATAGEDGTVNVWDPASGQLRTTFRDPAPVWSVAFAPDGQALAWGNRDGRVRLWSLAAGRELHALEAHHQGVGCLAFAPDGRTLASGGSDRLVKLWHTPTGQHLLTLAEHTGILNALAFAPDGRTLASASHDGTVKFWRAAGPAR